MWYLDLSGNGGLTPAATKKAKRMSNQQVSGELLFVDKPVCTVYICIMWKTHENEIVNPNTSQYYHKWLVSRGAIRHCSSRTGILSSVECEVVTHSGPRRAGILLLRKWVWRVSGSCHDKHTQTEPWPGFISLIHFQPPQNHRIHISCLWILISQISRQSG